MRYRASKQDSTKHSLYYMLYQRDMRLPIDAEINSEEGENEETALDLTISNLLHSRAKVFDKANMNIDNARKKQKETYD